MTRKLQFALGAWLLCSMVLPSNGRAERPAAVGGTLLGERVGVTGGLCVQVGGADNDQAVDMARSGRYLVRVLDADAERVLSLRQAWQKQGIYGGIAIEAMSRAGRLPYTENLVNLLLVRQPAQGLTVEELRRVLTPRGVLVVKEGLFTAEELGKTRWEPAGELPGFFVGRKPWPKEMDGWSHPHHGADGNAVSNDLLVAPPRRVRWLAGPWQEVSNFVSADGINCYGGVLARDGFNGMLLWQRELKPAPLAKGFTGTSESGTALPVAGGKWLYAYTDGKVHAFDLATGVVKQTYPEVGKPHTLLYSDGILIAVEAGVVCGLDAPSGRLLWKFKGSSPRNVVAGDDLAAFIEGNPRRGEEVKAVVLDKKTGKERWSKHEYSWLARVAGAVYYQGMLAYEVSTLDDNGPGNALHLLSAKDGKPLLDRDVFPGMSHKRQARAMFVGDRLWLLQGGRDANNKGLKRQILAIDFLTGKTEAAWDAGLAHCFPPVATPRFIFSGEMDLTDLATGKVDANRITKAACSRDYGWVPANGLIYVAPKHCVCWPMLRGYAALAPERPEGPPLPPPEKMTFPLERSAAALPETPPPEKDAWPCYRHDAWRSGSSTTALPADLDQVWNVNLGNAWERPGPIGKDWQDNLFVKGPLTSPVIAQGMVFVARPDCHEVVALDANHGEIRWRFTANGRIDTPPTLHQGLCLFGTKSGWVYCLRARDGQLLWRMRVAPLDEQLMAYGQLESPWPVPGSILVVDGTAYFAAGRQSLADGGILVGAVEPAGGKVHWVKRLDSVPQKGFYNSSAMEFDNFDLLFQEGDGVAMSRWVFRRSDGKMSIEPMQTFARLNTGGGDAWVPRGCWTYAPRHQRRTMLHDQKRPLVVFRDQNVFGCQEEKQEVYRREFSRQDLENFNPNWLTGWEASNNSRKKDGGTAYPSQRLAQNAAWTKPMFDKKQVISAMILAGDQLAICGSQGELVLVTAKDGQALWRRQIAAPIWDGMAAAYGRLFLSTQDGRLICLGKKDVTSRGQE